MSARLLTLTSVAIVRPVSTKIRFSAELSEVSLDIDIGLPYHKEIRGLHTSNRKNKNSAYRRNFRKVSALDHQSILFNSLVMGKSHHQQQGKSEVLMIGYYTPRYNYWTIFNR